MIDDTKYHIFFCTNARPGDNPKGSCFAKGNLQLRNYTKSRLKELGISYAKTTSSGCLGFCEEGPVSVVYPQGIWYKLKSVDDVENFIQNHIINATIVTELLIHG